MDFLNILPTLWYADATAWHSPSGLESDFSGLPCPEIARYWTKY